jgi:hypothetical protein
MEPDRWREVERLYYRAVERPEREREVFLAGACGGDAALRRAVASLLAAHPGADAFLETPAIELAAKALAATAPGGEGEGDLVQRLRAALADRYDIERELGRGGMARVYLALDRKHQRTVAIKVLRPDVAAAIGAGRFLREIAIAARVSHPHILPLHDSGDAGGFVHRRCNVGAGGECGIIQDSESRLAEFITGMGLEKHDAYTEQVITPLFADIALTPTDQPLTRMEPHLRGIAVHMAEVKAQFADGMRRLQANIDAILGDGRGEERKATLKRARRTHESPATRRNFAETLVRQVYANVGLAAPELLPDALVARVLKGAAAAVEFEALIWERVAFGGANPDARHIRSLRWDQRIAFNIGGSMRGRPLWLVTDDRAFTAVAKAVGCEDRVNTLAAYQRWLGISAGV